MDEQLNFKPKFEAFSREPPTDARSIELREIIANSTGIEKQKLEAEYIRTGNWNKDLSAKNTITAIGFQAIGNRLTGQSTYALTSFPYFAWSNGTTDPTAADTATTFYADGTKWGTKAVTTIDVFDAVNYKQAWECFLSTTDNQVASITKFALMNATPGTIMFNSVEFAPLSKTSSIERYLVYTLTMSQI